MKVLTSRVIPTVAFRHSPCRPLPFPAIRLPSLRAVSPLCQPVPLQQPVQLTPAEPLLLEPTFSHDDVKDKWWRPLVKGIAALGLLLFLVLIAPLAAHAGRTGGRMGGSNFSRMPSTSSWSYSPGSRSGTSFYSSRVSPGRVHSYFFPVYGFGIGGGGSSLFSFLFYAFAAYMLFSAIQRWQGGGMDEDYDEGQMTVSERSSVCKVQVGLLGLARGLQADLDSIARRANTSTPEGLHFLLQETLLALNRNPDYCVYGAAEVKRARSIERAEMGFNSMSMKERSKIKEETLSNWAGRRSETRPSMQKPETTNEIIVVTILVAAVGSVQIPAIRSWNDLSAALNKIGSIRARDVLAVEILWTPQDENDTFTPDELMVDYPELCAL